MHHSNEWLAKERHLQELTNFYFCSQVEDDLEKLKNASSHSELLDNIKAFGRNASELMNQAAKRQQELKDPQLRDDLAAARAVLKKHSTMLLTASKVSYLCVLHICVHSYHHVHNMHV